MTTRWEANALINDMSLHFETSHTNAWNVTFKAAGKIMETTLKSIYCRVYCGGAELFAASTVIAKILSC